MDDIKQFDRGDIVEKKKGYKYPGIVVAAFQTVEGKWRYVVECLVPEVAGMLHIYSGEQLTMKRKYENRSVSTKPV